MSNVFLNVNGIEVIYNHVILVLKGVSLQVPEGRVVALLGGNGAGKTTTLRAVSNLLAGERGEVTKGSIELRGERIEKLTTADMVERGVILPRAEIELVAPYLRSFAQPPDRSPFGVAGPRLSTVADAARVAFSEAVAGTLTDVVNPAFERLAAYVETAYRVLIDELPEFDTDGETRAASEHAVMGVSFRMRYSLPLFVHGGRVPPSLSWRIVQDGEHHWLQMKNRGGTHARISHVRVLASSGPFDVSTGLLGYVLPGAEVRWPIPAGLSPGADPGLEARINGGEPMRIAAN